MTNDNDLRDRVRRLEAENADLRRDYADLCALDPDGLRAKVVALRASLDEREANLAEVTEDAAEAWARVEVLASQVRSLEFKANPAVAQSEMDDLRKQAEASRDYLRLALADVERLATASVAEVLMERRREIRDLTARLNDALAAQERATAELRQWQRTTTFCIDPSEAEAERAFKAAHDARHAGMDEGSIGGRYVYSFCATSIGHVVSLRCGACGEKIDLTGVL